MEKRKTWGAPGSWQDRCIERAILGRQVSVTMTDGTAQPAYGWSLAPGKHPAVWLVTADGLAVHASVDYPGAEVTTVTQLANAIKNGNLEKLEFFEVA